MPSSVRSHSTRIDCGSFQMPTDGSRALAQCVRPSTWAQACLMDGGMLEWVSVETWRGAAGRLIGNPRQALYPCAFNPVSRPIQPVAGTRIRAAGVRFVLTDG